MLRWRVDPARGPDGIRLDKTPQHRVGVAQAVVVETRDGVVGPARVAKRVAQRARPRGLAEGPVGVGLHDLPRQQHDHQQEPHLIAVPDLS